ncbi:35113_t:CDS:2, partial [Racocetra persica]
VTNALKEAIINTLKKVETNKPSKATTNVLGKVIMNILSEATMNVLRRVVVNASRKAVINVTTEDIRKIVKKIKFRISNLESAKSEIKTRLTNLLITQNDTTSPDATSNVNKSDVDIDSLVTELAALKINHVDQEDQSKRDQVENLIQNIVTKTIKDMNKRPSQPRTTKPQTCYLCQEVGHIVKKCPKQNKGAKQSKNALKFDNVDVRIVEFMKIRPEITSKYLKVELLDDGVGYDVRPVSKRKREDTTIELIEYSNKKGKMNEYITENESLKYSNNVMYIPLVE